MEQRESSQDWTSERVLKACKAAGLTLSKLSEKCLSSKTALYKALHSDNCASYEAIIAEFLGLRVEDIWPIRCAKRAALAERRAQALLRAQSMAMTAQQVA